MMKKPNILLPTLLFLFFSFMLKAQPQSPAMQFWDWIMIPYNTSFDMSYNLAIDVIHSSPANQQYILKAIDELDNTTKNALKVYAELPADLLPEYEKLRKNAALAIKTMRVLLDFDNMRARELSSNTTLTSREVLQRIKQGELLSHRLDSIQRSFYKDIQTYAQSNKIRLIEGDTASAHEKKNVAEVLDFSTEMYKTYLESKIPFEDFLNFLKLEDTIALHNARKELSVVVQIKMKQLDEKRGEKSKDALFLEVEQFLKTLRTFSEKPSADFMKLLTTPKHDHTQQIFDDYNAVIKALNTVYLPSVNGFNEKYSEYKQNNIKPRKTKIQVVSSD